MRPELVLSAEFALAIVFAIALVGKVREPRAFVSAVRGFRMVPPPLAPVTAYGIIALEVIVVLTLITGFARVAGHGALVVLLCLFSVAMARNALASSPVPCHCFGPSDREARPVHSLARLVLLNAAALVAVLDVDGERVFTLSGALIAVGVVLVGVWILEAPTVVRFRRTPYPTIRLVSQRVSLRDLPLNSSLTHRH